MVQENHHSLHAGNTSWIPFLDCKMPLGFGLDLARSYTQSSSQAIFLDDSGQA